MKRKLVFSMLAFSLIACSLLSGCGFKDIDKRYFVVAMAIDKTENEEKPYRITLKFGVPSIEIDAGKSKTQVEKIDTASIAEGVRMLKAQVDKEIDFGHCNVFLLGDSLSQDNIREAVQWMSRRRDIQNIAAIGIGSPIAGDIIKEQPAVERFPGNSLYLFFSTDATESSYTFVELLTDLTRRLDEKGLDPILPIVEIDKEDITYNINKVALLNKEKVVLTLEPEDTQLLNQLMFKLNRSNLYGSFRSAPYVISIHETKTKYKIQKNEQGTNIDMSIKLAVTFEEMPTNAYFDHPEEITQQLETAYSEAVTKLLEKIQEAGVDPIGFGLRYRAKYQLENFDREWPAIYQSMNFNVKTKIEVRGTGLLK